MTPVEELREAARLMRERAGAATQGRWELLDDGDRLVAWHVNAGGFEIDFACVIDEPIEDADNAAHIASWHPAVALAVADWLDAEAVVLGERQPFLDLINAAVEHNSGIKTTLSFGKQEDGSPAMQFDTSPAALAAARTYLGTQP